jgi:hypothetical protein
MKPEDEQQQFEVPRVERDDRVKSAKDEAIGRIGAKITRAKQHIQDFQLALKAFHDTNPYRVALKDDAQRGQRIYYVSKADPVPDSLTTIADVLQNIRSRLDQIAYQLVLSARGGAKPDWDVYYPISRSATHYPAMRAPIDFRTSGSYRAAVQGNSLVYMATKP